MLYSVTWANANDARVDKKGNFWQCSKPFENFEELVPGEFPAPFMASDAGDLKKSKQANVYTVAKEKANKFLRAVSSGPGVIIYKEIKNWNLNEFQGIHWKWRAQKLPLGGDERYIRTNDAAAAVYVIWKSNILMRVKSIKFTWSSSLPIGVHVAKRFGNDNLHVLRNQSTPLDEWVEETIDVRSLYQKYMKKSNPADFEAPIAIAVLTDGDQTESPAAADYDDFSLCQATQIAPTPVSKR